MRTARLAPVFGVRSSGMVGSTKSSVGISAALARVALVCHETMRMEWESNAGRRRAAAASKAWCAASGRSHHSDTSSAKQMRMPRAQQCARQRGCCARKRAMSVHQYECANPRRWAAPCRRPGPLFPRVPLGPWWGQKRRCCAQPPRGPPEPRCPPVVGRPRTKCIPQEPAWRSSVSRSQQPRRQVARSGCCTVTA